VKKLILLVLFPAALVVLSSCGANASQPLPNLEVAFSGSGCDEVRVTGAGLGVTVLRTPGEVRRYQVPAGAGVEIACLRRDAPTGYVYLRPAEAPVKPVRVRDAHWETAGLEVRPDYVQAIAAGAMLPARPVGGR